jgi:hypothetical protein
MRCEDFWAGFEKRGNLLQKSEEATKAVFKGLSKKTEPAVLNYQAMHAADLAAKRAKSTAAGGTLNYANMKKPTFTAASASTPIAPPNSKFESWSKINQAKRAKMMEQERTGVIR